MRILWILLLLPIGLTAQRNYAHLVNPFIGTGGHGHTYPGASQPFGMVQLSPDSRMDDWDGCGGYHYSDTLIYGFSHTHLSGTGVPDYCDVLVQPFTGPHIPWYKEDYRSGFRHSTEQAYAGYYAVTLDKHQIRAELTATQRTGLHRYSWPEGVRTGHLLIDLEHRDPLIECHIEFVDDYTVRGWRFSKSWASYQKLYFVMQFDRKIKGVAIQKYPEKRWVSKMALEFGLKKNRQLQVKTGLSAVDMEDAMQNLRAEQKGFNFNKTLALATAAWNRELAKIEIESYEPVQDTIFYTALYHTMLAPNVFRPTQTLPHREGLQDSRSGNNDKVNEGSNSLSNSPTQTLPHREGLIASTASDSTKHKSSANSLPMGEGRGGVNTLPVEEGRGGAYTVFSLWDTHRALHPLMSIIDKQRTNDWVNTFLAHYKKHGKLPVWELAGNETNCMIGYHAVPVIVDAWNKDVRGFDTQLALEAMLKSAHDAEFGIADYAVSGFLGNEREAESASKTLEYAFDDGCIAQFARSLGRKDVEAVFSKRALNYRNLYNPATGFFHGKQAANWMAPFDPREVNNYYTEGNAWHYAFTAQQDLGGLIALHGGHEGLAKKLDRMFTEAGLTGRDQADVTGLIGQYAHGNEPSHHIAWLYNYTEKPAYGHRIIQEITRDFYKNTPDGLIGNEDCGQMSAWYIFATLGFYPVHPASNEFAVAAPQVRKATIHLENGKDFVITANRAACNHFRIGTLNVNGQRRNQLQINYLDLRDGGSMHVEIGDGKADALKYFDRLAPEALPRDQFVEVPFVVNTSYKFQDSMRVELRTIDPQATIYYCASAPGVACSAFGKYQGPISLSAHTTEVRFYAQRGGASSSVVAQTFYKLPTDKTIEVLTEVNPMYTDGGNISLIDGIEGTTNWRAGHWQSYYGNDFEAIIDLKTARPIHAVTGLFLQETKSWIWSPKDMEVSLSTDGKQFVPVGKAMTAVSATDELSQTLKLRVGFTAQPARYVRVRATNIGRIPDWHVGRGEKAHLFVGEVGVE